MKILLGALALIIVLFFVSQSRQNRHLAQSIDVFSIVMDEVNRLSKMPILPRLTNKE
jgi:hypothetical protein